MDATLAILTPEEAPRCLRFVDVLEKSGSMTREEAAEWRRRILAWAAFHGLHDSTPS